MKSTSTSTVFAYLLWVGIASQLLFNAPCFGVRITQVRVRPSPQQEDLFDNKNQESAAADRVIDEMMTQMKEFAVMADQDQIDRQRIPPLNCTIHIHPAAPSAGSLPSGESPDLWDQFRNLLINMSVWSITSLFSIVRETFNWFMSLFIVWKLMILVVILLPVWISAAEYLNREEAAAKKKTGNARKSTSCELPLHV